ncbi:MAG: hypothetical protein KatS3mg054_0117 [Chloroflexus sp.]|nr:MAG: hypothetical protein KatS3mg054_0117 [Chloroflexus sp.]
MAHIRAGTPGALEILATPNDLEPTTQVGDDTALVGGATASRQNRSTARLVASGNPGSMASIPNVVVDVVGASSSANLSQTPIINVNSLIEIGRNPFLAAQIGAQDLIRAIFDSPQVSSKPYPTTGFSIIVDGVRYSYDPVFIEESSGPLATVFNQNDASPLVSSIPVGALAQFTSGSNQFYWRLSSVDALADGSNIYLVTAHSTYLGTSGSDSSRCVAVQIFQASLKNLSPLLLVASALEVYQLAAPDTKSGGFVSPIKSVSLTRFGNTLLVSIGFADGWHGQIGVIPTSLPKLYSGISFSSPTATGGASSPNSITISVPGSSIFSDVVVGDTIAISGQGLGGNAGTFRISAIIDKDTATLEQLQWLSKSGRRLTQNTSSMSGVSAYISKAAITAFKWSYPVGVQFASSVVSLSTLSGLTSATYSGRVYKANDSISGFWSSPATSDIYVSSSDDGQTFWRTTSVSYDGQQVRIGDDGTSSFIEYTSPPGQRDVLPHAYSGSIVRIVEAVPTTYNNRPYTIVGRVESSNPTNTYSRYLLYGRPFQGVVSQQFTGNVTLEVSTSTASSVSHFLRHNIGLASNERITSIARPFLWSSYPSKSKKVAYCCTDSGKVFRTIDGGVTWEKLYSPAESVNNSANKNFALYTVWVAPSDDPVTVDVTLSSKTINGQTTRLTFDRNASSGNPYFPYWWPYAYVKIVGPGWSVVGVRAGMQATSFSNVRLSVDVVSGNAENLVQGSAYTVTVIPLPEVLVGGENGLILRLDGDKFSVLSAEPAAGQKVPRHFKSDDVHVEYGGHGVWAWRGSNVVSQSWEVIGRMSSSVPPVMQSYSVGGQALPRSTFIAGAVLYEDGQGYVAVGNSITGGWQKASFQSQSASATNAGGASVVVGRIRPPDDAQSDSDRSAWVLLVGADRLLGHAVFSQGQKNVTVNAAGTGLYATYTSINEPPSSVTIDNIAPFSALNSSQYASSAVASYVGWVRKGAGTSVDDNLPAVVVGDSNGNLFVGVPKLDVAGPMKVKLPLEFVFVRFASLPGGVQSVDAQWDSGWKISACGMGRDGVPKIWNLVLGQSDISFSGSDRQQWSISSPNVLAEAVPVATGVVAELDRPTVGGPGGLFGREAQRGLPVLLNPHMCAHRDGLYLVCANATSKSIDIYRSNGGGFFRVSSVLPPQSSGVTWSTDPTNGDIGSVSPRPRLVSIGSELILSAGSAIYISTDGGVTWHSGFSDLIPSPISNVNVVGISGWPSAQQFSRRGVVFYATGGIVGALGIQESASASTPDKVRFAFARTWRAGPTLLISRALYFAPVQPGVEYHAAVGGVFISFAGVPVEGDRYSIGFVRKYGTGALANKSPSVRFVSSSGGATFTWDATASKSSPGRLAYKLNSASLFGTNFKFAIVKVAKPSYTGSTFPASPSDYYKYALTSICDSRGKAAAFDKYYLGIVSSSSGSSANVITLSFNNPSAEEMVPGIFSSARRRYYAVILYSSTDIRVGLIVDNSRTELVVITDQPLPSGMLVPVQIMSDRMFSVLNKQIDGTDSFSGDYTFSRFVQIEIPSPGTSLSEIPGSQSAYKKQASYGQIQVGIATHCWSTLYKPLYGNESRHRFSRGFKYRERVIRNEIETLSGLVSVSSLMMKPRLEMELTYDDALWHDRDMSLSSLFPLYNKPICLVLDGSDPQTAEWVEAEDDPVIQNTVADRYTWTVKWREIV